MQKLAPHSRYYSGYDNLCGDVTQGRTYTRAPSEDNTVYADSAVTHVWLRPDVEIIKNDIFGATVTFSPRKGCPFVAPEPHLIERLDERDAERLGDVDA